MGFSYYLQMGMKHILDLNGYDHMLFVVALCAVYRLADWRRLLILLTAFTVGHSITLILAGLDVLRISPALIETLIPVTIAITALSNLMISRQPRKINYHYLMAVGFGLIHGAGFSSFFRLMFAGIEKDPVLPLLGFNLGIELGQVVIVLGFFAVYAVFNLTGMVKHRVWRVVISSLVLGISLMMIFF